MSNNWDNSVSTNPFFSGIARALDAAHVSVPDQGCPPNIYASTNTTNAYIGSQDGRISICETTHVFGSSSFDPRFQTLFLRATREPLPWVISEAQALPFRTALTHWRRSHPQNQGSNLDVLQAILNWFLAPDGLGMHMEEGLPEANAREAVQGRRGIPQYGVNPDEFLRTIPRGDCTEGVYALTAYLHLAGFIPEVIYTEFPRTFTLPDGRREVRTVTHMLLRVTINENNYYLDPGASPDYRFRTRFSSPEMPNARETVINYAQVLSWYYNNRASDLSAQIPLDRAQVIALYERARQIDPSNPNFAYNLALFYSNEGNRALAINTLQDLIQHIDRNYHPAYYQLGLLLRDQGQQRASTLFFTRAIQLASSDSRFRHLTQSYTAARNSARLRPPVYRRAAGVR